MSDFLVKFKKPYIFEGEEVKELDLSNIEDLTGVDVEAVEKQMMMKGIIAASPALSPVYCKLIASKATSKPIEFFDQMSLKNINAVTSVVSSFLLTDSDE